MNKFSPKEEMQLLIQQSIHSENNHDTYEAFKIYQKTFGTDDFIAKYQSFISENGPLVSLICLNCEDDFVDNFVIKQSYHNLEIVRVSHNDSYSDIINYICSTNSNYICFLESNHSYSPGKIADMVWQLENCPEISVAICPRNFIDNNGTLIAHPDYAYEDSLKNTLFLGKPFIEFCISQNRNLYGSLSTLLVSTSYAKKISWEIPNYSFDCINRISLIYQLLVNGNMYYMNTPLVSTILKDYQSEDEICVAYQEYVSTLVNKKIISTLYNPKENINSAAPSVSKNITFFCIDKGEYYNLKPIADEALKRGYEVSFTDSLKQKAEIGVYCQHICFPENSKFSLVLLHDMAQGHNRWPNIWEIERWNNFDIGIVPGESWAERWSQCASFYYVNPRCGTFRLGYPKSDLIYDSSLKQRAQELRDKFHFKYDISILYAPSWENDEKEDDFVKALASLNVNLLIKQCHWSDDYMEIIQNIQQMRTLHEGKYDNLYYIEPEESIMTALELCDIVVSDESSVMAEAAMFGKPSIAITDWLIPDTTPSRFADVPMDYVYKCKKVELRECIEQYLLDSTKYNSVLQKGSLVFSNQGHSCSDILDAIEYYTERTYKNDFLQKKLSPKYTLSSMWN